MHYSQTGAFTLSNAAINPSGKAVVLENQKMKPGRHELVWRGLDQRGRKVASGVYFYRFETDDFQETRRMLYLR